MKSASLRSLFLPYLSITVATALGACGIPEGDRIDDSQQHQGLTEALDKPLPAPVKPTPDHLQAAGSETDYGIGLYVDNVRDTGYWYDSSPAAILFSNRYCAFGTETSADPSISKSIRAQFSASVGISVSIVTAGVSFDVERTDTFTDHYLVKSILPGTCVQITAYPRFQGKSYEVWDRNYLSPSIKVGSGNAYRPIGFHWETN